MKTKKEIINRALEIREELTKHGFYQYRGLFQMWFPDKYREKKNMDRLGNFFSGQINDAQMLSDAEEVIQFVIKTSSKRAAA